MKNNYTISDILEGFKLELLTYEKSENTILSYARNINLFIQDFNIENVENLKILEDYIFYNKFISYYRKKGNSNSTINYKLDVLKIFCNYLKNLNIINDFTIERVQRLNVEYKEVEMLEETEVQKVLNAMKNRIYMNHKRAIDQVNAMREYIMVAFMVTLGLRVNEVCEIRVGDVDLNTGTIQVRGKGYGGEVSRVLSIPDCLYDLVDSWEEMRVEIDVKHEARDYYFVSALTKLNVSPRSIEKRLHLLEDELGIEKLHPHLLRHSFASNNLHKGRLSIHEVSDILGHKSIATTKKYYIAQDKIAMKKTSNVSNHFQF